MKEESSFAYDMSNYNLSIETSCWSNALRMCYQDMLCSLDNKLECG
jgi:hypothetical protein